jgi:predicted negative regulator of RcsB-dependent stress response
MEKLRQGFEGLSLSMRFVLPLMFAIGWQYYQNDQRVLRDGINDIKAGQKATWEKIDTVQTKEQQDYIYTLQNCCNKGTVNGIQS